MKRSLVLSLCCSSSPFLPRRRRLSMHRAARRSGRFSKGAVARGDVPGVVVLVTAPDRVLYHEAFGKMNVAKGIDMQKDTIFNIASMTKAVTSAGVMMLVEEGKLRLDDEVSKYLPAFKSPKVISKVDLAAGTYETRPATRADHDPPAADPHLGHRLLVVGSRARAHSEEDRRRRSRPAARARAWREVDLRRQHECARRGHREDLGPAHRRVPRERDPRSARDARYDLRRSAAKTARVVTRNQKADGKITETPNPAEIPATIRGDGGLYSTAADYARFVQMILNHGQLGSVRLLKEQTVREMARNQTGSVKVRLQPTADPLRSKPYPLGAGEDVWGLGFQLAAPAKPAADMRRPGSMNWAGINNTFFWIDPEKQIGVIVLMQVLPFYDDAAIEILQGTEKLVYQHVH